MWAVLNKDGSIRWTSIHERNAEAHGKELGLLVVKLVEDGTNGGR